MKFINNNKNKLNREIILIFHYHPKSKHTLKNTKAKRI